MGLTLSYTPRGGFGLGLQKVWASEEEDDWWEGWDIDDWCDYIYSGDAADDGIDGHVWLDDDDFINWYGNDMAEEMTGMDLDHDGYISWQSSSGSDNGYWVYQSVPTGWIGERGVDGLGNPIDMRDYDPNKIGEWVYVDNRTAEQIVQELYDWVEAMNNHYNEMNNYDGNNSDPYDPNEFEGDYSGSTGATSPDSGNPNIQNLDKGKGVTTEIDCTDANKKVDELMDNLAAKSDTSVQNTFNELRAKAQDPNNYVEHGAAIDYKYFSSNATPPQREFRNIATPLLTTNSLSQNVAVTYGDATALTLHDHTREAYAGSTSNYATPSPQDFATVIDRALNIDKWQNDYMKGMLPTDRAEYENDPNRAYKGEYVVSYNGSEYLLYVQDLAAATAFRENFGSNITDANNFIEGTTLRYDYQNALKNFKKISPNDANGFALVQVMQNNNAGIKLMKKNKDTGRFEEQAVKKDEKDRPIPVIKKCP